MTDTIGDEQAKLWNGTSGQAWVDAQAVLDRMFRPFEDFLAETAAAVSPSQLLDIGCGTGATTLAATHRLGAGGHCTGIDISEPMLAMARGRAEAAGVSADFIRADAESYDFAPGRFDLMISRFGVMFFADSVRAFANLRRAASDRGQLCLITWRGPDDNPFMTAAHRAAAPLLPDMPAPNPDTPGQFAFADPDRVRDILAGGGWSAIAVKPMDVTCCFPEAELLTYITRLGPVGRILNEQDDATRARIVPTVRAAFDPFVEGNEVTYTAACWLITAQAK